MRIITGSAKGRKLKALPGTETRPTSDRLKESMMDIVQFAIEGRLVLDLFSGSGQLGLEALSRGAEHCVFVEMSAAACGVIRENIDHTGFGQKSKLHTAEALRFLRDDPNRYDLIFLDPPYHTPLRDKSLEIITARNLLRPGGFMICECASLEAPPVLAPPYFVVKTYPYGKKQLVLMERRGETP